MFPISAFCLLIVKLSCSPIHPSLHPLLISIRNPTLNPLEFLPGKRAFAIGLCVYHTVCSTILYQAPRFIPQSFGPLCEQYVCFLTSQLPMRFIRLLLKSDPDFYQKIQNHAGNRMGNRAWDCWPRCSYLVARDGSPSPDGSSGSAIEVI